MPGRYASYIRPARPAPVSATPPREDRLEIGARLAGGRFELIARLGDGGMGSVYAAHDLERQTRVALKILRPEDAEAVLRFKAEFRALQDLHHPNWVRLHELFEDEGRWFFTMELLDGIDFLSFVRPPPVRPDPPSPETTDDATPSTGTALPIERNDTLRNPDPRFGAVEPSAFSMERLRSALLQLTNGLQALHRMHKVHRDIKPANLLVTAEGRVVILDFGVVSDARIDVLWAKNYLVGTAAFMAPEQARGARVGPAADWYAVGVILYLCVSGHFPIGGPRETLLARKQTEPPAPPSWWGATVDPDLEALIMALLEIDPRRRASGVDVLNYLRAGGDDEVDRYEPSFVGRDPELDQLADAFDRSQVRGPVVVWVEGESGIGKTTLVERFTREVREFRDDAVVIGGRCYERESVPFKAIDGVVDALSRALLDLTPAELEEVIPPRPGLLAQAFPVLGRVPGIAGARTPRAGVDPQEQRRGLFAAVRELLLRFAERRPLLITIDDLQWTDRDSLALFEAVLSGPDGPPLLLVCTFRRQPNDESVREKLLEYFPTEVETIELGSLTPTDARLLAGTRLDLPDGRRDHLAERIAREAGGHPLFIAELKRYVIEREAARPEDGEASTDLPALALEDVLFRRIQSFEPATRQILELVATAGKPISLQVVMDTLGLEYSDISERVAFLRSRNLLRTVREAPREAVSLFHDRVRAAVLLRTDADARREWHHRLACALETWDQSDLEAIAFHFERALELPRAVEYAQRAAEEALAQLALDRAIRMFRLITTLAPARDEVRLRLADTLAAAGSTHEAAREYETAARFARPLEAVQLRCRAAEQLFFSGDFEQGMAMLKPALAAIGWKLPATTRQALASLLYHRAQVALSGLRFEERADSDVAPRKLAETDIALSVAFSLGLADVVRASDFFSRGLLLALKCGEPRRVARALSYEALFLASTGIRNYPRACEVLEEARALATRVGDAPLVSLVEALASLSQMLVGRWRDAVDSGRGAVERLRECRMGVRTTPGGEALSRLSFEMDRAQCYVLEGLVMMGRLDEHRAPYSELLRDAVRRRNAWTLGQLQSGIHTLVPLAADHPDIAEAGLDEAIIPWSRGRPQIAHSRDLSGRVNVDLYRGDPARAVERIKTVLPVLRGAQLLRPQLIRITLTELEGRAQVALALALPSSAPRALARAEKLQRILAREGTEFAESYAITLRALIDRVRGRIVDAIEGFESAAEAYRAQSMRLHEAAAWRARGLLLGGHEGATEVAKADHLLGLMGVRAPERFAELLAPTTPPRRSQGQCRSL